MIFRFSDDPVDLSVDRLTIAGWTGRDPAAVAHHIEELREIGVAPPSETPLFYRVSASLLSLASVIQVLGAETSGEAEPIVLCHNGRVWIGLGSDHTDRELEAVSVAASKQACAKVCAAQLWSLDEVEEHLDQLRLRSWIKTGDAWEPYQDGTLAAILPVTDLIKSVALRENDAMFCGTLPAIGGIRPSSGFRAELSDPALNRSITMEYQIEALPVVS